MFLTYLGDLLSHPHKDTERECKPIHTNLALPRYELSATFKPLPGKHDHYISLQSPIVQNEHREEQGDLAKAVKEKKKTPLSFFRCVVCVSIHTCVGKHMPQNLCGGQRATSLSGFMLGPWVELRSQLVQQSLHSLNCLFYLEFCAVRYSPGQP